MSTFDPPPAAPPPRGPFQFTLRTLLLLFIVLGSSMAVFGAGGILVFVLVVGLAVYLREAKSLDPLLYVFLALLCLGCLIGLLMPAVQSSRESSRYSQCRNNLKQLVLALIEYNNAKGHFPAAYTADSTGKPMHSWRTEILPFLDVASLYKAYDFTKPWDAAKNKTVSGYRMSAYECSAERNDAAAQVAARTNYFAIVGPNAAWAGDKPRTLADFGDQAAHTILVVEAAGADVAWAEPVDVSLETLSVGDGKRGNFATSSNHRPPDGLFYNYDGITGVNVACADGSVSFLRTDDLSADELRRILQIGGYTDEVMAARRERFAAWHWNWPKLAALGVWLASVAALLGGASGKWTGRYGPLLRG